MAIPEAQLTTWAEVGAQATSRDTYATIKGCLDQGDYSGRSYCNFLQGSYGNDTNIFKESDVDVVMELLGTYYYDVSRLTPERQQAFRDEHGVADYVFKDFKEDVFEVLQGTFGSAVTQGTKAITVAASASGARRKADVLACTKYKRIVRYDRGLPEQTVDGICFYKADGTQVVNYPRLHSQNLIAKNAEEATDGYYKHAVRIFKNARQKLIADGVIAAGVAPSYYVEGLLFNVPNENFGTSYASTVQRCLQYLYTADRSQFVCANRQYPLLDGSADVTWNSTDCTAYVNAFVGLWNNW